MNDAELYQARRKAEADAGREINHIGFATSEGMTDWHECSCGWKSKPCFDGAEYAQQDWVKHILEHKAEINYPDPEIRIRA